MKYTLLLMVLLFGCRVGPGDAGPMSVPRSTMDTTMPDDPSFGARCEPSRCDAFCDRMSCVFGGAAACLSVCRVRCGDAYFELADEAVLSCVVDGEAGLIGVAHSRRSADPPVVP